MGKFIKQAQFLKQLSKISAIHFLSYRVPYGVSRTAFYRKLRHEESSHSFRSQPVVAVFFHQTCSRPRGSDLLATPVFIATTWLSRFIQHEQSFMLASRCSGNAAYIFLDAARGISFSTHNKSCYRKCYDWLLSNAWRERENWTYKQTKILGFFLFTYHNLNTKYVNLWPKQI